MRVYLDNAATTALDKEVVEAMLPYMTEKFGNPSSTHQFGSEVKVAIEQSRKTIAKLLNVSPAEIIFTSGGTEANNMALRCSTEFMGIKHAITSPLEHHAVLHTLEDLAKLGKIKLSLVNVDAKGNVDLAHLEELLAGYDGQTLVSLMHANNEIGNLLPIEKVSALCEQYKAVFHTDTVQTMCHYPLDFQAVKVHFASCAAHKFHGPKGVGFLYMSADVKIPPFITGGAQERNMRGGTENVYGIVGLGKAFEIAHRDMEKEAAHIRELKGYMIGRLRLTNLAGTQLQRFDNTLGAGIDRYMVLVWTGTLSAGATVIVATQTSSSGTAQAVRSATSPAQLVIEDLGPA